MYKYFIRRNCLPAQLILNEWLLRISSTQHLKLTPISPSQLAKYLYSTHNARTGWSLGDVGSVQNGGRIRMRAPS
jgi:hypothetical protein